MKEPGFGHHWNYDDVFARSVIVGLMKLIDIVKIKYQYSDDKFELKRVPFLYSFTGSERFLQDFFVNTTLECDNIISEGGTDVIPRANVKLDSDKINNSALKNKFVRGSYIVQEKDEKGNIYSRTYSSYINMIPMEFSFSVLVTCNTMTEIYKIRDQLINLFYKAQKFNSSYKGFRIPCQAGFSEEVSIEKLFEYSYPSGEGYPTLTLNITVEAHYPVIDETTELFRGNLIKGIDLNLSQTSIPYISNGQSVIAEGGIGTVSNSAILSNMNEIPFLSLWLNGNNLNAMGKMSNWKDSSLLQNNIIELDITKQPNIIDPIFCAEKGISTNGISNTVEIPNINILNEVHGFLLMKSVGIDLESHMIIGNTQILEDRWALGFKAGDLYYTIGTGEDSSSIGYANTLNEWKLVEFWFANKTMGLKINNQLIGVSPINRNIIGNFNSKTFMFSNSGVMDFLPCNFAEIMIWKKQLTDKQREFVINYYSTKYQIF